MTSRTLINETNKAEKESQHYLIVFDDNTYAVAERKLVLCQDTDLKLGTKVKVRNGQKTHIGNLTNIGLKQDLERVAALQFGKKMPVDEKANKKTSKRKQDAREDAVPKPSKRKNDFAPLSDDSENEASEDEKEKENEKLFALFSSLGEKPIANIPRHTSCECKVQVEHLTKELRLLKEKMHDLERTVKATIQKAEGANSDRPMVVPSPPTTPGSKSDVESSGSSPLISIEHNGFNLLTVKAPAKEPKKNALRLLDKLFTIEELSQGILFASKRSEKQELDQNRVQKMFEVLHANYGKEKVQRMHQHIVDACNQKCRDCARKLGSKEKQVNENDEE